MKGEYVEAENDKNDQNTNTPNMFAKFSHHHPKFQPPPPPHHHFPPPHLHSHHPPFPDESDSATTTPPSQLPLLPPSSKKPKTTPPITQPTTSNEDGTTIEVSRCPRARPPGSKNKPKPPIVVTREPEPAMSPVKRFQRGMEGLIPYLVCAIKRQSLHNHSYRSLSDGSKRSYHLLASAAGESFNDSSHRRTQSEFQAPTCLTVTRRRLVVSFVYSRAAVLIHQIGRTTTERVDRLIH